LERPSRTLYALARDRTLATVSHQTGTPADAMTASMTLTFAPLLAFGLAGTGALDAFFYLATTGALSLLMVYVLVSVSALRLHVLSRDKRRLPAAVLPLGGAVAALYVLLRNLIPAPAFPYSLFSYLVGAGSCSGSRSRRPCHSHAGESAKASRVAEFADRTPPRRSPG
jgi:amino acid transporter